MKILSNFKVCVVRFNSWGRHHHNFKVFIFFYLFIGIFFLFKLSCFQNSLKGVLGLSLIALCKETESSLFLYCFVPDCWKRLLR